MIATRISLKDRSAESEYVKVSNYDSKAVSCYCYEENRLMYAVTHIKEPYINLADRANDTLKTWVRS